MVTALAAKRPPFLMKPSRIAVLRCDGIFVISGRASFVWETFLLRRASGVPGLYEISGPNAGVWHKLDWTIEEATEMLRGWGMFGVKRVSQMEKLRASRSERGLPVK